jgi:hypothetical protein
MCYVELGVCLPVCWSKPERILASPLGLNVHCCDSDELPRRNKINETKFARAETLSLASGSDFLNSLDGHAEYYSIDSESRLS